jgi:hypothetical protein
MSGRRTDSPVMAQRQAKLMSSVIYDGSVLGRAQNPLEWFSLRSFGSASPDPGLNASGLSGADPFERTFPSSPC